MSSGTRRLSRTTIRPTRRLNTLTPRRVRPARADASRTTTQRPSTRTISVGLGQFVGLKSRPMPSRRSGGQSCGPSRRPRTSSVRLPLRPGSELAADAHLLCNLKTVTTSTTPCTSRVPRICGRDGRRPKASRSRSTTMERPRVRRRGRLETRFCSIREGR